MKVNIWLGIDEPVKRLEYEAIPKETENDVRDITGLLTRKIRQLAMPLSSSGKEVAFSKRKGSVQIQQEV